MDTRQAISPAAIARAVAARLTTVEAARDFVTRSGLTLVTLRAIARDGLIRSYVTALKLDQATDGELPADLIVIEGARGRDLYTREPARSLLIRADAEGVTIAKLLARYQLTLDDLRTFMASPNGITGRRDDLFAALHALDLPMPVKEAA